MKYILVTFFGEIMSGISSTSISILINVIVKEEIVNIVSKLMSFLECFHGCNVQKEKISTLVFVLPPIKM